MRVVKQIRRGISKRQAQIRQAAEGPQGRHEGARRLITKAACWDAEVVRDFIKKMTCVGYNPTYFRGMMRKWGFSMKVPVMGHVNRAGRRRIAKFKKQMKKIQDEAGGAGEGWTVGVQDE